MQHSVRWLFIPVVGLSALAVTAHAAPDKVILSEDFSGKEINARYAQEYQPAQFTLENGVLVGQQLNPAHSAVFRTDLAFVQGQIEFDAMFRGARSFNINLNHTGARDIAHFGHIARVSVSRDQVRLIDDREGNSNLKFRALPKEDRQAAIKPFNQAVKLDKPLEEGRWYRIAFEIRGETARLLIDGKEAASMTSPGFGHPMKDQLALNVAGEPGGYMYFDNLKVTGAQ